MYFKTPGGGSPFKIWRKSRWANLGVLALIGLFILGAFWFGLSRGLLLAHDFGYYSPEKYFTERVPSRLRVLRYQVWGKFKKTPALDIQIDFEAQQKLAFYRKKALKAGYLMTDTDSYVSGEMRIKDSLYQVKLRLKGDQLDHLRSDKWSFRVKIKGDAAFRGMKEFSLQHPMTRGYAGEWVFFQAAQQEGLIALRYQFIPVFLNGEAKGIYALEESFTQDLLAHNHRREGLIFKFDESRWWQERLDFSGRPLPGYGEYHALPITIFNQGVLEKDSSMLRMYQEGLSRLACFQQGNCRGSEVFDMDLMGGYLALADLFGAIHSLHINQFRFYLNPVTGLYEPIPYDAGGINRISRPAFSIGLNEQNIWEGGGRTLFLHQLLQDSICLTSYLHHLDRICSPNYLESFLADIPNLSSQLEILAGEFPEYSYQDRVLYANRDYLRTFLYASSHLYAEVESAEENRVTLRLANLQRLPVHVLGIQTSEKVMHLWKNRPFLTGREEGKPLQFHQESLPIHPRLSDSLLKTSNLVYKISGLDSLFFQPITYPENPHVFPEKLPARRLVKPLAKHPFIRVDESQKLIHILPGKWKISAPLVFPTGYQVKAGKGTLLSLQQGAYIISYAPLVWQGSPEDPIIIRSEGGQGLLVSKTVGPSFFQHVIFEGLSPPELPGTLLSGALSFYESEVAFRACQFIGMQAEDALNIIRSDFSLENCAFRNLPHDALDADFCRGRILRCSVDSSGNDGLDFSGSSILLEDVRLSHIKDKGLSIGEASEVRAQGLTIQDSRIGIAVKDRSKAYINNLRLARLAYGVCIFQKKASYGPAFLKLDGWHVGEVEKSFLLEDASRFLLYGKAQESNSNQVSRILYPQVP